MRRPRTSTAVGAIYALLRTAAMAVTIIPIVLLVWLSVAVWLVVAAPKMVYDGWMDWRFHRRRYPGCGFTLREAMWLHVRMWWHEVRD